MRPLNASELLDAWERGLSAPPAQRALTLLEAACPDVSSDSVAALSIGERDAQLLMLREWTFGSHLVSVANCSDCGERLEWTVSADDLRVVRQAQPADALSLELDLYRVEFRLPNTADLAAVAACEDTSVAREILLGRCLLETRRGEEEIAVSELPPNVAEAVVKQMGEADPQADVQLDLSCPVCGHRWQALFDIGSFFWREIDVWAQRILTEVHVLASAYGWRESDILNLSMGRRQFYLDSIGV